MIPVLPETRESRLIRLADAADAAARDEFVAIYRPIIVRTGLRNGLQATEADDLAQQVLMSVSRVIGDWKRDSARGTLRCWLRTFARNAVINMIQRTPKERAVGGSEFLAVCHEVNTQSDEIAEQIETHRTLCFACREQLERAAFCQEEWQRTQSLLRHDELDSASADLQLTHGPDEESRRLTRSMVT